MPVDSPTSTPALLHLLTCGIFKKPTDPAVGAAPAAQTVVDASSLNQHRNALIATLGGAKQRIESPQTPTHSIPGSSTPQNQTSQSSAQPPINRETFAKMWPSENVDAASDSASNATLHRTLAARLTTVPAGQWGQTVHNLLGAAYDAPPEVQEVVGDLLLRSPANKNRLSPFAQKAATVLQYRLAVQNRYCPKDGSRPSQYGWEVSPVNFGIYDSMIAAMNESERFQDKPLLRMPRLDQFGAELVVQAKAMSPGQPTAFGYTVARMGAFFHQVGFEYKIEMIDGAPLIKVLGVDSEKKGKEIALQLREAIGAAGVNASIHMADSGMQKAKAGCPIFSPCNVENMSDHRKEMGDLFDRMDANQPLHPRPKYFSTFSTGHTDVTIGVYKGEDLLPAGFYRPAQSSSLAKTVDGRQHFDRGFDGPSGKFSSVEEYYNRHVRDILTVDGQKRPANFTLETSHGDRTQLLFDYMKSKLATLDSAAAERSFDEDIANVRASSLGDDDDRRADNRCKAAQFADEIGEPVVWFDISEITDTAKRQALINKLDSSDFSEEINLGYLHPNGFPVYSNWTLKAGKDGLTRALKDDGYFHAHANKQAKQILPSAYIAEKSNEGATFNFVAVPQRFFNENGSVFAGLPTGLVFNTVEPRLRETDPDN